MKFFKKAAAIVTTLAMLVTAIPMSVSADNVPSDIKGHWAEDVLKENTRYFDKHTKKNYNNEETFTLQ